MSNRRKLVIALGAGALAAPLGAFAQPSAKVWRIGSLDLGSQQSMAESGRYAALIQGLNKHGYVEGKNIVLAMRYAEGNTDRLDALAADLVRQNTDVILATGTPAIHAAKRATAAIPIIVTATTDPVGDGFARSLARPGGNITGMTTGSADTIEKLVEFLLIAVPKLKRIAVINNPAASTHAPLMLRLEGVTRQTGQQILPVSVGTRDEIERGFAFMMRERAGAAIIFPDSFLLSQRAHIAGLALKYRLPSINALAGYAEVGGLMSYGADINDNFRRAGIFVDKIFKGAKPGEIPFEQPTRYFLVINAKTAKQLGIGMSNALMVRADKVIE